MADLWAIRWLAEGSTKANTSSGPALNLN